MYTLLLVPVGTFDSSILTEISGPLQTAFRVEVNVGAESYALKDACNISRRQCNSTAILENMRRSRQTDIDLMLGVTSVDLYAEGLTFVFGEADISSGVAIISLTRLRQEFYGLPPDSKLLTQRAVKEAIHETGHLYGLPHCRSKRCIMHFSKTLRDTDIKGPGFCDICRIRLDLSELHPNS